jgi:hypothetical protein
VLNGRLRCAATRSCGEVWSLEEPRYQDAVPSWLQEAEPPFGTGLAGVEACCACGPEQPATAKSRRDHVKLARMVRIAPGFTRNHGPTVA